MFDVQTRLQADAAEGPPVPAPLPPARATLIARRLIWGLAAALAVVFFAHAALRFLDFSEASYRGFWVNRHWLLVHFVAGSVALLAGIMQFWAGLRRRLPAVHRWTGRAYLAAVAVSAAAAYYMSFNSIVGWTFGVAGFAMATAWVTTTAMAYVAIRRGQVQAHRQWMTRSYVVTFGFVVFRVLAVSPLFAGAALPERLTAILWLCWVVPLLACEVVLQWRATTAPARRLAQARA